MALLEAPVTATTAAMVATVLGIEKPTMVKSRSTSTRARASDLNGAGTVLQNRFGDRDVIMNSKSLYISTELRPS